jgi:hypothetical protein
MHSVNSYQDIKTPEDYEYEDAVQEEFENLCDYYADEIAEQGMNWQQKASLMARARQLVNARRR